MENNHYSLHNLYCRTDKLLAGVIWGFLLIPWRCRNGMNALANKVDSAASKQLADLGERLHREVNQFGNYSGHNRKSPSLAPFLGIVEIDDFNSDMW